MNSSTARFGVFEADLRKRELRKQGRVVPFQQQPFSVLAVLLERAGEVVSREELQKAVWPADTFVDFDFGLNTAIKKIRVALGDSADTPSFVETVPRKGYQFIASVSWDAPGQLVPVATSDVVHAQAHNLRNWMLALFVTVFAIGLGLWVARRDSPPFVHAPVPLSTYPGQEHQPSFSPDGRSIVFVWDGGKGQDLDIYIQPVAGGHPFRLTQDPAMDVSPVWSPDGGRIAFVRIRDGGSDGVFVVPSTGGPEVQVSALRERTGPPLSWILLPAWLAWTPDGDGLVLSDMDETSNRASLFLAPLSGGPRRRLTNPNLGWRDSDPAFSPDHRSLAFIRSLSIVDADVFALPLASGYAAASEPRRISSLHRMAPGLAWTRDGREIIFASGQRGASRLWRASVDGEMNVRALPFSPENALWPAISPQGHLAYTTSQSDQNVWRAPLRVAGEPKRLIGSTRDEADAKYSPDGRHILFLSKRTGANEIWIAKSDGSSEWQLTNVRASFMGSPNWSPDGSTIVFDSSRDGTIAVFTMSAAGGSLRKLTDGKAPCGAASYSRDGRWIYYHCFESGNRQMWRIPAQGGAAKRLMSGFGQLESHDGRLLYFAQSTNGVSQPLWRVPTDGGPAVQILADVEPFNYAVTPDGIYFASAPDNLGVCVIRFLDFATRAVSKIGTYTGRAGGGMSVSPDGQWLLYSYDEQRNGDIMVVEGFR